MAVVVRCPESFAEFIEEEYKGIPWIPFNKDTVKTIHTSPVTTIYVVNDRAVVFNGRQPVSNHLEHHASELQEQI